MTGDTRRRRTGRIGRSIRPSGNTVSDGANRIEGRMAGNYKPRGAISPLVGEKAISMNWPWRKPRPNIRNRK